MIDCNTKNLRKQIELDYNELKNYKNSYEKRVYLYNVYLDNMKAFEQEIIEKNKLNIQEIEDKINKFQIQIKKLNQHIELLDVFLENVYSFDEIDIEQKYIDLYNQTYIDFKNNYINNSILEEDITTKYISGITADFSKTLEKMKEEYEAQMKEMEENIKEERIEYEKQKINCIEENDKIEDQLKNNDTLLISEKQGKVILPYRAEEVYQIFDSESNKYQTYEEVIEDKFTRNFSDYKIQFYSRYVETMKLAREREKYNLVDSISISLEMMKNKYLHPAIISACKTLNELDVYLDCLDKNELEDFKIFKIKYELYPMVIKNKEKMQPNMI